MKFNFTFGQKQRAGVVVAIACLVGISLLSGCTREKVVRWDPSGYSYVEDSIEVYWKREVVRDKNFIPNDGLNLEILNTSYMRTRMNLDSMQSVDEAISEETFQTLSQNMTNCLASYDSESIAPNSRPIAIDCETGWSIIGLSNAGGRLRMLVNPHHQTDILPNIRPFSLDIATINESGDCAFFDVGMPYQRRFDDGAPFALFKDGQWWEGRLPGKFPDELHPGYSITSNIPALVRISEERLTYPDVKRADLQ